jgi:hypothetical protein
MAVMKSDFRPQTPGVSINVGAGVLARAHFQPCSARAKTPRAYISYLRAHTKVFS